MGKGQKVTEQSFFSHQVPDYHASPRHFLVLPGYGDQAVDRDAEQAPYTAQYHVGSPTRPVHGLRDADKPGWERPFDCIMVPEQYTEVVSVAGVPAYVEESCVTYVDLDEWDRWKETVTFGPGLCPHAYRSSMIVYKDCTKKKFISRVEYETRLKPKRFEETRYVTPRDAVHTYVSFLDFHVDETRKWYTTTVDLKPKTFSSTKVQNFEYRAYNNNEGEVQSLSSEDGDEEDGEKVTKYRWMNGTDENDSGIHLKDGSFAKAKHVIGATRVKTGPYVKDRSTPVLNGYHSDQPSINGQVNGYADF